MIIKNVYEGVYKITGFDKVNFYFLDFEEKTLIDCGNRMNRDEINEKLSHLVDLGKVKKVILTKINHETVGNFDLFPNAKFYAGEKAVNDYEKDPYASVQSRELLNDLNVSLTALPQGICFSDLEIIFTPGHTNGSICVWWKQGGIMFSGDTVLHLDRKVNARGAVDMPTSRPELYDSSVEDIMKHPIKMLAPGHDWYAS